MKSKILEAAVQILYQKGYRGTSINDIVSEAGVSKGAFFHYFGSKEEMVKEMLEVFFGEITEKGLKKIFSNFSNKKDPKEQILEFVDFASCGLKSNKYTGGCLIGNSALELSDKVDSLREVIKNIFLEWEELICAKLKELEAQNRLKNTTASELARFIIWSIQGATLVAKVFKEENRADQDFEFLKKIINEKIE